MKPKTIITIILIALLGWAVQGLSEQRKVASSTTRKQVEQAATGLRVIETSDTRVVLEWAAPPLKLERDQPTGSVLGLDMQGIAPDFSPGVPRLPKLTQLFDAYEGAVNVQLLEPEYEVLTVGSCLPMPEDYILDERNGASNPDDPFGGLDFRERMLRTEKKSGLWPERVVEVVESGVYRGHRLMALHLNPVQVNAATGEGRILKNARIIVSLPPAPDNQVRLPDSPGETNALKDLLGDLKNTALPTRAREERAARDSQQGLDDDDFPVWNVNRWKIYVRSTSIVRLTGLYMRAVGIPIDDISPWDLHISHKGREIPIVVEGQEDGNFDEFDHIDFFGERNEKTFIEEVPSMYEDPFSSENCYMMWWGDGITGLRLGEQDGSWQPSWIAEPIRSVRVTTRLEKDRFYYKLPQADNFLLDKLRTGGATAPMMDHWFMEDFVSAQSSREYEIFISAPNRTTPFAFNRVIVRACLTGFSSTPGLSGQTAPWNHYVCVSLNALSDSGLCHGRQFEGDPSVEWLGQTAAIFETLPPDPAKPDSGVNIRTEDLVSGTNFLTVNVPGNAIAGNADKVLVNWFEIEYERDMRARNGEFRFNFDQPLGDTVSYDIRGFGSANIQVWKLGESRLTSLETRRVTPADESASWAVRFPFVSDGPHDLLAFGENYVFPPFMVVPDTVQIDLRNQTGAEYVVVAFDAFIADTALHMLDSLRRVTFNNSVLTVPISEVYEQFSSGIKTPYAIRDFMQYAYDHWSVRPTHLCLVGDAVTERIDDGAIANQVPTFTPFTEDYGVAPADYLFGCVSGPAWDIIPDIAVGRISCRTPQELATYVQKLIVYESQQDFEGLFQSNVLFVADHTDQQNNFGRDYSERTLDVADPCMNITRVYLDSIPSGQGPIKLRDALRDGAVVCNYNGHGGGGVWSGSELIDVSSVRLLNNRNDFPFVTNFTCYVGAFDSPSQADVLGEAFIFTRNNNDNLIGGIGFYSSSGVGWALSGRSMQRILYGFLLNPPARTIGEAATINKARYWSSLTQTVSFVAPHAMMMMMNLLGDPGVKLALPQESIEPEIVGGSHFVSTHDSVAQDSVRLRVVLPWAPTQTSRTFVYALPYNDDRYRYTMDNGIVESEFISTQTPAYDPQRIDFSLASTQICTTDVLSITNRLVTPRGKIVVYATDPVLKRSAIGCVPIFLADSLNNIHIYDITPLPSDYVQSGEPFRVQATILHQDDLESVRFRGVFRPGQGPIVMDTLSMDSVGPGLWQTSQLIGPYETFDGRYQVKFFVMPTGGSEYESPYYDLPLEVRGDLSVTANTQVPSGEVAGIVPLYKQTVTVMHFQNSSSVDSVTIRLSASRDSTYTQGGQQFTVIVDSFTVDQILTSLDSGEVAQQAFIPTTFTPGEWDVKIEIDPEDEYVEGSTSNNTRLFTLSMPLVYPCTRTQGTAYWRPVIPTANHRVWKTGVRDTLALRVFPNKLGVDSAAIQYTLSRNFSSSEIASLNDRELLQPFTQNQHGPFAAMFADSVLAFGPDFEATVSIIMRGQDTLRSVVPAADFGLFYRDPDRDEWRRAEREDVTLISVDTVQVLPIPVDPRLDSIVLWNLTVEAVVKHLGEFAIFNSKDTDGPSVEVAAGGLRFTQNAIVPSHPQLFITISDPNAVQRGPGTFYAILDGDTLEAEQLAWNDTVTTAQQLTAMFEPDLEEGSHTLDVLATDCHGNTSAFSTEFEVRGQFGIEWALNYPNPFKKNTTIAFVLTGVTDDFVEIKIYTVSGRLIKTWHSTERALANYQSWIWGGTDDAGEEVANGVYFARIKAKQGDKEVEEIVKLAKVR